MSKRRDTSVGGQAGVEEKCSKDLSRVAAKWEKLVGLVGNRREFKDHSWVFSLNAWNNAGPTG